MKKRKKEAPAGPKEGDWLPPIPGVRDVWHRVALVMHGKVKGVEVWHGDPPPGAVPANKAKPPKPAWVPKERNPFELSPVVEKFLSWRFQPVKRPTAGTLTGAQKDRLLRLALVGKKTNWYGDWPGFWANLRAFGLTDAELMLVCHREFGASKHADHQDKRRAFVDYYRKGKKAVFVIGESDDPDRYVLEGAELLCAVRRTMTIKRNF